MGKGGGRERFYRALSNWVSADMMSEGGVSSGVFTGGNRLELVKGIERIAA